MDCPDQIGRSVQMHGLQIGRAATHLPGHAARPFDQHRQRLADAAGVEGGGLRMDQILQPPQPFGLDLFSHLIAQIGAGVPGRVEYLNE